MRVRTRKVSWAAVRGEPPDDLSELDFERVEIEVFEPGPIYVALPFRGTHFVVRVSRPWWQVVLDVLLWPFRRVMGLVAW